MGRTCLSMNTMNPVTEHFIPNSFVHLSCEVFEERPAIKSTCKIFKFLQNWQSTQSCALWHQYILSFQVLVRKSDGTPLVGTLLSVCSVWSLSASPLTSLSFHYLIENCVQN